MFTPENLEDRRLLSVAIAFDATSGQLQVFGKDAANDIRVTLYNTDDPAPQIAKRIVAPAQQQQEYNGLLRGVSVYDHDELVFNTSTSKFAIDIQSIDVWGNSGADVISMYAWNSSITTRVFSAEGNDAITATAHQAPLAQIAGDAGDDAISVAFSDSAQFQTIDAGPGNDSISAFGGRIFDNLPNYGSGADSASLECTVQTRLILGGDGNDTVNASLQFGDTGTIGYHVMAGAGNDRIVGSDKLDQLFGDDGNDEIYAGDGDDYLNGGLGDDELLGENGDDFLDHGGGTDMLNGGAGHDKGIFGKDDIVIDLEEVVGE